MDVCLSSLKQHRCIAIHAEETSSSGGGARCQCCSRHWRVCCEGCSLSNSGSGGSYCWSAWVCMCYLDVVGLSSDIACADTSMVTAIAFEHMRLMINSPYSYDAS